MRLPMLVRMARSSRDSGSSEDLSSGSSILASSNSSSQYWLSAASFSTIPILWPKSLPDSARFASRKFAPMEVPLFPTGIP